jgi:hypothetical protein
MLHLPRLIGGQTGGLDNINNLPILNHNMIQSAAFLCDGVKNNIALLIT